MKDAIQTNKGGGCNYSSNCYGEACKLGGVIINCYGETCKLGGCNYSSNCYGEPCKLKGIAISLQALTEYLM